MDQAGVGQHGDIGKGAPMSTATLNLLPASIVTLRDLLSD